MAERTFARSPPYGPAGEGLAQRCTLPQPRTCDISNAVCTNTNLSRTELTRTCALYLHCIGNCRKSNTCAASMSVRAPAIVGALVWCLLLHAALYRRCSVPEQPPTFGDLCTAMLIPFPQFTARRCIGALHFTACQKSHCTAGR